MRVLEGLDPQKVFYFFEEICNIPHGSRNVKQISDYLVAFAKERNLEVRQDEALNVVIKKPGTAGYEEAQTVIIQGHMDMVAVKDEDCDKDLLTDGLDLMIEGDMLTAKGTSLGGDDGIAVAYALAVLDAEDLAHPPIEAVITTNEEIGLLGAAALDTSDLKGSILLNIDSEDEGIFTISCAGGASAYCELPCEYEEFPEEDARTELTISVTGFTGGHSGVEINKGRMNATCGMGRILLRVQKEYQVQLVGIIGGDKDNAITNACKAKIAVKENEAAAVQALIEEVFAEMKDEQRFADPDMKLAVAVGSAVKAMTVESTKKAILLITELPQGIQKMNPEMKDMVQTSLNLGVTCMKEGNVFLGYSVRSSKETEKNHLIDILRELTEFLGGTFTVEGDYPGWDYCPESRIRDVMVAEYIKLYGSAPIVEGIHAGLECGLFAAKIPGLDAISFGPQMHDIHTTNEKLSISSTKRTWELLVNVLASLK